MSDTVLAEWPFSFHIKEKFDGGVLEVTSKDVFVDTFKPTIALVTNGRGSHYVEVKHKPSDLREVLSNTHPHICDDSLCLGDLSDMTTNLALALQVVYTKDTFLGREITRLDDAYLAAFQINNRVPLEQYYDDYEDMLQALLNTYNAGSPYILFHNYYLQVFKSRLIHPTTLEDLERVRTYLAYVKEMVEDSNYDIGKFRDVNAAFPNLVCGVGRTCSSLDCTCSCCRGDCDCDCEEGHDYPDEHDTCEGCTHYDDGDCEDCGLRINAEQYTMRMEGIAKAISCIKREQEVKEVLSSLGAMELPSGLMSKLGGLLDEDINF